jgi:hypothetical protein
MSGKPGTVSYALRRYISRIRDCVCQVMSHRSRKYRARLNTLPFVLFFHCHDSTIPRSNSHSLCQTTVWEIVLLSENTKDIQVIMFTSDAWAYKPLNAVETYTTNKATSMQSVYWLTVCRTSVRRTILAWSVHECSGMTMIGYWSSMWLI